MLFQRLADEMKTSAFLSAWIIGPVVFFLWMVVLLALKKKILAITRRHVGERTTWLWAESLIEALSPSLTIAILAGGVALLDRILPLSPRSDRAFDVVLMATLILAIVIFADRICRGLVARLADRSSAMHG